MVGSYFRFQKGWLSQGCQMSKTSIEVFYILEFDAIMSSSSCGQACIMSKIVMNAIWRVSHAITFLMNTYHLLSNYFTSCIEFCLINALRDILRRWYGTKCVFYHFLTILTRNLIIDYQLLIGKDVRIITLCPY